MKASVVRITLHAVVATTTRPSTRRCCPTSGRPAERRPLHLRGAHRRRRRRPRPRAARAAGGARSKAEVEAFCGPPRMWWALRTFAPCCTPRPARRGLRTAARYVASGASIGTDVDAGRATLVRRYLEGFGPASAATSHVHDAAQATRPTGARRPRRSARAARGPRWGRALRRPGRADPGGQDQGTASTARHVGERAARLRRPHAGAARAYRPHVIRRNGDVLPTVLVDGQVAGVWRSFDGTIEVAAFHALSTATWRALTAEAHGLAAFLVPRDRVYRRHNHWWDHVPHAEVRRFTCSDR